MVPTDETTISLRDFVNKRHLTPPGQVFGDIKGVD